MTTTPAIQSQTAAQPRPRNSAASTLAPLVLDLGVPLGSYYLMRALGVAVVPALALSSIVPALRTIVGLFKDRKVNLLATLIIVVNVVGIAVTFWIGNPRLMLAKEAAISSVVGIALLVSALAGRPLMNAGLKPMLVKANAAREGAFDKLSDLSPRFKRLERIFSAIWGLVLLADCVTRVICAFTLPVGTMVWLSTVMIMSAIGLGVILGSPCAHAMDTMVKQEAGQTTEHK